VTVGTHAAMVASPVVKIWIEKYTCPPPYIARHFHWVCIEAVYVKKPRPFYQQIVSFSKKEKEWEIVLATTHMMSLN
jgi:hypothetical protein